MNNIFATLQADWSSLSLVRDSNELGYIQGVFLGDVFSNGSTRQFKQGTMFVGDCIACL